MISPTRRRSFSFRWAASLASVVVLPTPVGPTSAATCGPAASALRAIGPATASDAVDLLDQLLADDARLGQLLGSERPVDRSDQMLGDLAADLVFGQRLVDRQHLPPGSSGAFACRCSLTRLWTSCLSWATSLLTFRISALFPAGVSRTLLAGTVVGRAETVVVLGASAGVLFPPRPPAPGP